VRLVPAELIDALPKAELHVHLEGTLEPTMLLDLAARNGIAVPWNDVDELRNAYRFDGLEHFLVLLFRGAGVLRQRQDFYDLTAAYLARAHRDGVRRSEMFFGAQTFLDAGVDIGVQLDGVMSAIDDARNDLGIDGALILTAQRHRTQEAALELVELARPWHHRLLGFGLGGAERGNPPAKFVDYFSTCRRLGARTTIHAGEDGPASYVREAIDLCRPDRIDHGVAAAGDRDLIKRLADERIPLTMCPLSNQRLHVVPDLADHPLLQLHRAGVLVTINSDDPPYFGGYVNDNYRAVAAALDLSASVLAELAANSFRASFTGASNILAGLTDIAACLQGE
jgi:adenosine deaminase